MLRPPHISVILLGGLEQLHVAVGGVEPASPSLVIPALKSPVVNELHKAIVPPRGLFASGKFSCTGATSRVPNRKHRWLFCKCDSTTRTA
jgi:hypothetical protein